VAFHVPGERTGLWHKRENPNASPLKSSTLVLESQTRMGLRAGPWKRGRGAASIIQDEASDCQGPWREGPNERGEHLGLAARPDAIRLPQHRQDGGSTRAKAVLAKHHPELVASPQLVMAYHMPFRKLANFPQSLVDQAMLDAIDADLKALGD
jgi:hypothetical protein